MTESATIGRMSALAEISCFKVVVSVGSAYIWSSTMELYDCSKNAHKLGRNSRVKERMRNVDYHVISIRKEGKCAWRR
jgi:hypothetical protein